MIASRAEILAYLGIAASATEAQIGLVNLLHPLAERAIKERMQNDVEQATHIEYLPMNWRGGQGGGVLGVDDEVVEVRPGGTRFQPNLRGSDCLQLKHTPVVLASIEVREDPGAYGGQATDSFGSSTVLTLGSHYWLDVDEKITTDAAGTTADVSLTGHLHRNGYWPVEPRSVKVTYTGGWNRWQLDAGKACDIKLAVFITMMKAYKQQQAQLQGGAILSESLGKYSVTYDAESARNILGFGVSVPPEADDYLQQFMHYGRLFN